MALRAIVGIVLFTLMTSTLEAQEIRYEPPVVDFGVVPPCKHALDSFELVNESTDSVSTTSVFNINGFQVSFADATRNILVGERRRAYVRFVGDASIPVRNQVLAIQFARVDGSFVPTQSIRFIASRSTGPCVQLAIPSITALPGTSIDVGIVQEGNFIDYVNDLPDLTFEVSWDPTVMVPQAFPVPPIASGLHRATFRVPLSREGGKLLELPFVVTLGNRSEAPITLVRHSLSDPSVIAQGRGGRLTVDGVCLDPRSRLFDASASVMRTFMVYNLEGRVIETVQASSMDQALQRINVEGVQALRFCVDPLSVKAVPVWPR